MRTFHTIGLFLLVISSATHAQTLSATASDIVDVIRGVHYRVDPNPQSSQQIFPSDNGESASPAIFQLTADSGSRWAISFIFPSVVRGSIDSIQLDEADSTGYWVEGHQYFNAHASHIFTADSIGKITIGFGATFTVPACALSGDTYSGNPYCFATNLWDISTLTQPTTVSITTSGGEGCGWIDYGCDVSGVIPGQSYTVAYDAQHGVSMIVPALNGETTTDLEFDLPMDPLMNIFVSFKLPEFLTGTSGMFPITFGSSSGVRVEDGILFDPKITNVFKSDARGSISLRLGFSLTVPPDALSGDTHSGFVLCTAAYKGPPHNTSGAVDSGVVTTTTFPVGITVTPSSVPTPQEYSLHQNYPNPFNSGTTIRYDLPEDGEVRLTITDVLGREIGRPVDEFQYLGRHTVRWDAGNIPSGVYIYRISAGRFSHTRKMILTR